MRAGNLAGLLLGLIGVAVAEPGFELVIRRAAQREQDHRTDLLTAYVIATGACSNHVTRVLTNQQPSPSAWVRRFAPLIRPGGRVLDLAAGAGRHTSLLLELGFRVTAVDRDIAELHPFAGDKCHIRALDLEAATTWSLGG